MLTTICCRYGSWCFGHRVEFLFTLRAQDLVKILNFCAGISRPWVESPPRRTLPSSSLFPWVRMTQKNWFFFIIILTEPLPMGEGDLEKLNFSHHQHHNYFLHWASSNAWDLGKLSFLHDRHIIILTKPFQWVRLSNFPNELPIFLWSLNFFSELLGNLTNKGGPSQNSVL